MTYVIFLPVWQLILLVVAVAIGTSIPCAAFGAWLGARRAIRICSAHNDCAKVKTEERKGWQEQLERQHAELLRENPEALARRRAAEDAERRETPAEGRARRPPWPPDVLVAALQDRCHRETGKTRPGRSVRMPREAGK